ncbi:DUF5074 domain-containing protein [Flavobacterium tyrosinilyticum]|uniref:DUF5074 domain-containing protein n=1 Tax=Flavobacterium tyrosinilyticum TaxID=1658740 RepID=UPI00202F431F|nr:DUF5074 domain-containing protein [Flavobacterium tyrosinilyticum]MCM0666863.1 DUF5074 domain-containing protein [Flavobacterium tyrosinilyticum]
MRKNYFIVILLFFAFLTNAQVTVQGVSRNDIKTKTVTQKQVKAKSANATTFADIQFWVGSGSNQAAFVVQWNDGKTADALVWGFKWNGTVTGEDMVKAIAKADPRFFALLRQGTQYGSAIGGLGFDLNGTGTNGLYKDGDKKYPYYPFDGLINTSEYDFDSYTGIDPNDHWQSGWMVGYWSYWVKDPTDADYNYSGVGASTRELQNGSWDVWNFKPNMETFDIAATFTPVAPYSKTIDFTKGYFMVNEEWFGHTNGSVNFVSNDGKINYRVYSDVNENKAFGATTQYGTIYGDKFYFVSKQAADGGDTQYTPGGRLVVADALTMKKIAGFDNIGGGDGRSFIGVDEKTGYIGASNGVFLFDIANMKVGSLIAGTDGGSQYLGQIGNMIRTSQYVFAVKQSAGILVIDPKTNTVVKNISGAFHSVTQAKDGSVWGIQNKKIINIDPLTFATIEYAMPTTQYLGSWGAWNAGSFTYSNKQNALYWMNSINSFNSGVQIIKFDVATKTFNESFATLPGQTGTYKQIPYGAALRIDPVSDQIIVNTTESGFGAHYQKNWVHTYDTTGQLIDTKTLNDYYWFPAMTVFPDNAAPVVNAILPSQVSVLSPTIIDLKAVVSDEDNISAAIVKTIKSNSDENIVLAEINTNEELVLTPKNPGTATVVVSFNSNGKVVEKSISVNTSTLGRDEFTKVHLSIYPNPVSDYLNISSEEEVIDVVIYDVNGRTLNTRINNNQIDVSNFVKGFYIINIATDKAKYTQKFIKK